MDIVALILSGLLVGGGLLGGIGCSIWVICAAFGTSGTWGLLVLLGTFFFPPLNVAYVVMNWDDARKPFLANLTCVASMLLGALVFFFGYLVKYDGPKSDQVRQALSQTETSVTTSRRVRHFSFGDEENKQIDPELLRKAEAIAQKNRLSADVATYATKRLISDTKEYDPQTAETEFVRMHIEPPSDHPGLSCYFLAPKNWQTIDLRASGTDFKAVPTEPFELAECQALEPHVTLEAWLVQPSQPTTLPQYFDDYVKRVGMTVSERKDSVDRIDALVRYDTASTKRMMARMTFVKVGSKFFWLSGCSPENAFFSFANAFSVAAATFSPVGYAPTLSPVVATKSVPWKATSADDE
jgi:hypothetical protein